MAKSSIVIDFDDPRSDKIAEAISNKTSKKIVGVLAEGEMSGSEIAEKLGVPLNTATYNLKKLNEAGLIEKSKRIFWSSKGKKMEIYKLSNKRIVIYPRKSVKGIAPALVVSLLIALVLAFSFTQPMDLSHERSNLRIVVDDGISSNLQGSAEASIATDESDEVSGSSVATSAPAVEDSEESDEDLESYGLEENFVSEKDFRETLYAAPNSWAWYLIGALTALLVVIVWNMRKQDE